jgi:hypothetical protein
MMLFRGNFRLCADFIQPPADGGGCILVPAHNATYAIANTSAIFPKWDNWVNGNP